MPLLRFKQLTHALGDRPLIENQTLEIDAGERIALVGRNGEGKSTLLKILSGQIVPDEGERQADPTLRIAMMPQTIPDTLAGRVYEVIIEGAGEASTLLHRHHHLSRTLAQSPEDRRTLQALAEVQQALDASDGWRLHALVERLLTQLNLPADAPFDTLSGGQKRRVLLARALARQPDILLLDEPTNHLDIPAIERLEHLLKSLDAAIVFITHDRAFLQALATRILELDRGRLYSYPGDWETYLKRRDARLAAEARADGELERRLAEEEAWIRQGIKARRTRNEGRVRALEALRRAAAQRRHRQGRAKLNMDSGELSGRKVIEVESLTYAVDDRPLIENFSTLILRGDKVGIIGPNGCGKSTLLKLLLGTLSPQQGRIRLGTRLNIAYFDQHRAQLDPNLTVAEAVADRAEWVQPGDRRIHVMRYLQDFLFPPHRARQPVSALSGGERNRLLLARILARPANLLVLDEPTNDLDMETLELLEEKLVAYSGTLILVSHDRTFLDNTVSRILSFDAPGILNEYVGGYSDWLRQRPKKYENSWNFDTSKKPQPTSRPQKPEHTRSRPAAPKLTYREQQEYEALPGRIEALEHEITALHEQMQQPDFFQQSPERIKSIQKALQQLEDELELAFDRWEQLENKLQAWLKSKTS